MSETIKCVVGYSPKEDVLVTSFSGGPSYEFNSSIQLDQGKGRVVQMSKEQAVDLAQSILVWATSKVK